MAKLENKPFWYKEALKCSFAAQNNKGIISLDKMRTYLHIFFVYDLRSAASIQVIKFLSFQFFSYEKISLFCHFFYSSQKYFF